VAIQRHQSDLGWWEMASPGPHPHLNRDFREFAGTSPSSYLGRLLPDASGVAATEDVPFVQDSAAAAA
jgi:hypothetical protein